MSVAKLVKKMLALKFGDLRFTQEYADGGKAIAKGEETNWHLEQHSEVDGLYSLFLDDIYVGGVETLRDVVTTVTHYLNRSIEAEKTPPAEVVEPVQSYYLVSSINSARFETVCNEVLQAGGTPLGGLSTAVKHGSPFIHYSQAFLVPPSFVETEKEDAE